MCPFLQIKIQNQGSRQKLVGLCTDIHNFAICQQNMIHWHTWTLQSITVRQIATPGEGCSLLQKIFEFFLFQNGEFLCMPAWIAVWYFLPFRVMPQAVTKHVHMNWSKSAEIVFSDSRKRRTEELPTPPPPLPGIAHVKSNQCWATATGKCFAEQIDKVG